MTPMFVDIINWIHLI